MELEKNEWLQVKEIIKNARSVITRWYRDPPKAEGGDFLADMHRLRESIEAWDEYMGEDAPEDCPRE